MSNNLWLCDISITIPRRVFFVALPVPGKSGEFGNFPNFSSSVFITIRRIPNLIN